MDENENYRMTDKEAEDLIKEYLINHGFETKRFDTKRLPSGVKSPDFHVFDSGKPSFYCEVKNPLLLANEITKMFHWTTSVSKIRRFVHRAVEQFHDVDENHRQPWIISFTSTHMQLNWTNFNDAYLGYVARGTTIIQDLRNEKYVINYNNDMNAIDAFMWCQVNAKDKRIYQFVPYINADSELKSIVEGILKKIYPYEEENIVDASTRKYMNKK